MPAADITTVILRFRDLSLAPGETIARHVAKVDENGATWWAWWAPGDEQPADDALRVLRTKAQSGDGLDVYLFDSGQKLVYRAHCDLITWSAAHERMESPERDQTPDYYSDGQFLAWFHFTLIELVASDALQHFTYVDVPELFRDPGTTYAVFAGKRIASVNELHYQRRTMWFVRVAQLADPSNEILLVGRDVIEPRDFQDRFLVSKETTLLWLSDIHFAVAGGHHAFPLELGPSGDRRPLSAALRHELDRQGHATVAGLIVSGDLTWRAEPAEYSMAEKAIKDVASPSGLMGDPHRIAVVPGNHDLRYSATPEDPQAEVSVAPATARRPYEDFYRSIFNRAPNQFLSMGRRFLLGESIPVEIVLLNSSLLEQVPDVAAVPAEHGDGRRTARFQGQGFVGEAQLTDATAQMRWSEPRGGRSIRIVVLHHHLVPVSYSEPAIYGGNYSVVLDAGRLARWLVDNRVDVVLHGHQHAPFLSRVTRPIDPLNTAAGWHSFYVVGLGSTGVVAADRPADVSNMFGMLEFSVDRLSVSMWSIDQTQPSQQIALMELDLLRA